MVAYVSQIFFPPFAMPYMKFLTNCNITEHGYENICVFLSVTFYKNIIPTFQMEVNGLASPFTWDFNKIKATFVFCKHVPALFSTFNLPGPELFHGMQHF